MNFDEAISAHVAWKARLAAALQKDDPSLDVSALAQNDRCALGKWLAGEGRAHAGRPEFQVLVEAHTAFHLAAADVVRQARAGVDVSEAMALGAESPFGKASSTVISSLMKLKRLGSLAA